MNEPWRRDLHAYTQQLRDHGGRFRSLLDRCAQATPETVDALIAECERALQADPRDYGCGLCPHASDETLCSACGWLRFKPADLPGPHAR